MTEKSDRAPALNLSRSGWQRASLGLIPFLFAFWVESRAPALLIDDAYITFRYAENLVRGHGLVFNPGERVLGTTAPLWAGLLAAARELGAEIPAAALLLGQLFCALSCAIWSSRSKTDSSYRRCPPLVQRLSRSSPMAV
jgi:hypothetical protein